MYVQEELDNAIIKASTTRLACIPDERLRATHSIHSEMKAWMVNKSFKNATPICSALLDSSSQMGREPSMEANHQTDALASPPRPLPRLWPLPLPAS